jgi:hypothetical protein
VKGNALKNKNCGMFIHWLKLKGVTWKNILAVYRAMELILQNLNWEGCMISKQWRLGSLQPCQHLLEDRVKPRKPVSRWSVAGPSAGWLFSASSPANERHKFQN